MVRRDRLLPHGAEPPRAGAGKTLGQTKLLVGLELCVQRLALSRACHCRDDDRAQRVDVLAQRQLAAALKLDHELRQGTIVGPESPCHLVGSANGRA